jgi:subfamily B ATP-binding cassette protein MsbA
MRTKLSWGIAFLIGVSRSYRTAILFVILFCFLATSFDGISIGMLVPLIRDLQKVEGVATPSIFAWADGWVGRVPENWRAYALVGFVLGAIVLKNAFFALSFRLGHWLSSRLVADLRAAAVRGLLRAGVEFHDRSSPADLLMKALHHTSALETFIRTFVELAANSLTLVVLVGVLFVLSWPLALLAIALGAMFLLFSLWHARGMARVGEEVAAAESAVASSLHESLGCIRLIKSYSREPKHLEELEQGIERVRRAIFRRNFKVFSIHPITDVAASAGLAALLLAALALSGWDSRLMLARTLPFMFVLLRIVPLLKILNCQKAEVFSLWPYLELVGRLLRDQHESIPDGHKQFRGLRHEVCLEGVTFGYRSRSQLALDRVNFRIPAGKTTAIVGESGSGKSTLVNLLLRLYDPQQGRITLDGEPLTAIRLESYHRRVSVVSQDTFLFNETVRFNIGYAADDVPTETQMVEAAKRALAHDFIMEMPAGYDTVIGDRGVQLSGGQRQRLALARAILTNPEVLILDEATSALDAQTERGIQEALREFGPGRTVIVIAHRPSTIEGADQVVVLKEGRVVEVHSPTALSA